MGSLPYRFSIRASHDRLNYISDVYDSILLKDVVEKLRIKDITAFNKVLQYVVEIEGKEFSAENILAYLKREQNLISSQTLYNYLEALCSAFILNKVYRYDVTGKTKKGEVDFIALKNKEIKYIQVCYYLSDDEKTIAREFGAYDAINEL